MDTVFYLEGHLFFKRSEVSYVPISITLASTYFCFDIFDEKVFF